MFFHLLLMLSISFYTWNFRKDIIPPPWRFKSFISISEIRLLHYFLKLLWKMNYYYRFFPPFIYHVGTPGLKGDRGISGLPGIRGFPGPMGKTGKPGILIMHILSIDHENKHQIIDIPFNFLDNKNNGHHGMNSSSYMQFILWSETFWNWFLSMWARLLFTKGKQFNIKPQQRIYQLHTIINHHLS